ncbi:TonB-dependent receptor [Pedobacter psychrodurus]|uniref:TonB-dependent receptor n=1 Tax=Pedobacter psychrodurus TaxID=2530456 RepID=A0A4R0PZA1_9SPHI|nr:TonB-dependent receptor [Pedobacter psychrodurus]TCD28561.1 TonB-dependent receptor [Pedobacter psychrodurus]
MRISTSIYLKTKGRPHYLIALFALAISLFISQPLWAQTPAFTVSGKISSTMGETLPGVSVSVKGGQNVTTSDANGSYKITLSSQTATLVFSYVGFKSLEVPVSNRTSINVQLVEDSKALDDVVVVAYGSTTQRSSTGALQTVNAKELQDIPAAQITQKLQGKLAGVQINQASGKPGQGLQVRIRGGASISTGAGPLYVVDGFPIAGDISNINPDEIENITVLKDAASTSLYGSRAAFGVVVVTTKAAKSGQTNISASVYTGTQQVPQKGRPDMMNGTEWAQFKKEYYEDLGQPVPVPLQNPTQYGEGYDWYDAMLRSAPLTNYSISLNTNKENFSSSIVAGYFKQDGVLLNSGYERFSVRLNSLFKVNDQIKVGFNLAPTHTVNNSPSTDGMFFGGGGLINNALLTPPVLNYQNPDGSYPVTVTTAGITAFPTPNWVRSIQDITNKSKDNRILSNGYVEYEPISKLVLKSSINVDFAQSLFHSFQPSTASRAFASTPSPLSAGLFDSNYQYQSWLSENTVNYSKQINDHGFDVLAGFTKQKYRSDYSTISGSNYPDDRIETIAGALIKNNSTSDIQEWSLTSFLARLNYNYKGKYLFAASIRRDGSSRFGSANKWGNFPSVSAGWVLSQESFLRDLKLVSFFKIRGSYGVTGNNNIGNYTQYATVSSGVNSPFGSTTASGVAVTNLGNDVLGWETTKQLDLGIDLSILNNRINFTYDYYSKKTSDLLFSLAVPRESGFSSFTGNVGEIKFWGHEFAINSNNLVGKFKWNTNFNIAFSDNKVLALSSLSDRLYTGNGTARSITQVGQRIGQFWGLIQDGVYKDQADFNSSPKSVNSQVGTIKFRDLNGDGVIKYGDEEGDRTVIGNPFPKFVFGLTNSFTYKNFDFTVVASGSYGNDIARMMDEGTTNLDGVFNVLKEVKDRWRSPQNPGAGKYGKTTASTGDDRAQFHTRFVQDGSYLTIKNITLGYSLPVEKLKVLKSVRFYASIQQAFVFTNYDGINPEIGTDLNGNAPNSLSQGLDFSAYPVPRTFTFGLNVNFK